MDGFRPSGRRLFGDTNTYPKPKYRYNGGGTNFKGSL